MKRKTTILLILIFLLCAAPISNLITLAGTQQSVSEAEYSLTIIEDEEVPLADGSSGRPGYYFLYTASALLGMVVICYIGKKVEWRKTLAKQEIEVADKYMDKLISEEDDLR